MATSEEIFKIFVVSPHFGTDCVLLKIRKWLHENRTKHCWHIHPKIEKHFKLTTALSAARLENEHSILIPIGFQPEEVKKNLDPNEKKNLEVIIRPPRPSIGLELDNIPHSSFLSPSCTIAVQNTLPAIHKSILRKHFSKIVTIRKLLSENDFEQYFSLRYKVWNELGYLSDDKNCIKSKFELNYTDRNALPIGIFNEKQEMIACARLIFTMGQDNHHTPLIKRIIEANDDPQLKRNFARPPALLFPFDLLECFPDFNNYFAKLVREGVRNAEVSRVIVDPDYRHSGLGEVLVDSLITIAKQEQLHLLFLACNTKHHDFYQQCGFKPIKGIESDSFKDIVQQSVNVIAMFNQLKNKYTDA